MKHHPLVQLGGLRAHFESYERQKCFLAFSEDADWATDLKAACEEVLNRHEVDLELDFASRHLVAGRPLVDKVLELIANARYGIYDLSFYRDQQGQLRQPSNVYIEMGIGLALNRPMLLLWNNRECKAALPDVLEGLRGSIIQFTGFATLKDALESKVPAWLDVAPNTYWANRFCLFGGKRCEHREAHPRGRHWGRNTIQCHVSDGPDRDRSDFRQVVEDAIRKNEGLKGEYLDDLRLMDGYQFLLCSHCQVVRSTPLGIYRVTPQTTAATYLAIGISIALESQFQYRVPRILITDRKECIPSLLAGLDVVVAKSDMEKATKLQSFLPAVVNEVRQTQWRSDPIPFTEPLPPRGGDNLRPVPFMAPAVSPHYGGHVRERQLLLAALQTGRSVIVRGARGVGTSSFVAWAAYEPEVRERFYDGVLWAFRGADYLSEWIQRFGSVPGAPEERVLQLRSLLEDRRCLLVFERVDIEERLLEGMKCVCIFIGHRQAPLRVEPVVIELVRPSKKALLKSLEAGQRRKGIVRNIVEFGAFVDLGGLDGLLHITDMSYKRIGHPSEMVGIGEEIEVVILHVDRDKEKVALGLKQKGPGPWEDADVRYPVGARVKGTVARLMTYGAWVKLEEGIEGLVHISEMSWARRITHPSELVKVDDEIEVSVLGIDKERQEVSLGMKRTEDNPWNTVAERYPPGISVTGVVRNLTAYGAFIEIEEGIDGLLHVSDMSWTRKISHPSEMVDKGQKVECRVLSVDQQRRRIALGLKQLHEDPRHEDAAKDSAEDSAVDEISKIWSRISREEWAKIDKKFVTISRSQGRIIDSDNSQRALVERAAESANPEDCHVLRARVGRQSRRAR